jgi:hypothetical protein
MLMWQILQQGDATLLTAYAVPGYFKDTGHHSLVLYNISEHLSINLLTP